LFRPAYAVYRALNRKERLRFRRELGFYAQMIQPGQLCFDVGANIGKKSEVFLELGARVVAFEPQADCFRELNARCARFGDRVRTCQSAVGDRPGNLTLHVPSGSKGMASVLENWGGSTAKKRMSVQTTTLDLAIAEHGRPDYVKIDVEGYEFEVLRGLTSGVPLLSFEYHLGQDEVEKVRKCVDYLSRFGELRLNLTPSDLAQLEFKEWIEPSHFFEIFPDRLLERGPQRFFGDIFVRLGR
jgi:FkbM family methyltransferase